MDSEIRKLVRTMAGANPIWGAPRIHGELLKLGFEISERTGFAIDAEQGQQAYSNLDDLSSKSCWANGIH